MQIEHLEPSLSKSPTQSSKLQGEAAEHLSTRAVEGGMDDYLTKPFTLEQMHTKLCTWLNKRNPN